MTERTWTSPALNATCALVIAVLVTAPIAPVHADGPDFSLSVTPTRLVVPADLLGQSQDVRVTNSGRESLAVEVGKRDFVQRPDGALTFQAGAPYSASNWVRVTPARFRLGPGSAARVRIRIRLPDQPDAGDHQVAVVFLVAAGTGSANIRINRGVGLPVFLTAPGPVDDTVRPENLRAPRFALSGPIRMSASVRSVGTVHRDFRGPDRLRLRVAGRTVPFPDFTVNRGAVRHISTVWADPPLACVCRATVTLTAPDGTPHVLSARVIVVRFHLIAVALGGALLVFVTVLRARLRYLARAGSAALPIRRARDG